MFFLIQCYIEFYQIGPKKVFFRTPSDGKVEIMIFKLFGVTYFIVHFCNVLYHEMSQHHFPGVYIFSFHRREGGLDWTADQIGPNWTWPGRNRLDSTQLELDIILTHTQVWFDVFNLEILGRVWRIWRPTNCVDPRPVIIKLSNFNQIYISKN